TNLPYRPVRVSFKWDSPPLVPAADRPPINRQTIMVTTRYGGGGGGGGGGGDVGGDGDGDGDDGDGLALIARSGFARLPPCPERRLSHRRPSAERRHSELAEAAPRKSGLSKHP